MNETHPHYIWAFVALIALAIGTYIFTLSRPDIANYGKDSTHAEQVFHNTGLLVMQPGCQNIKAEEFMKLKKQQEKPKK